jgi:hypothetical protein
VAVAEDNVLLLEVARRHARGPIGVQLQHRLADNLHFDRVEVKHHDSAVVLILHPEGAAVHSVAVGGRRDQIGADVNLGLLLNVRLQLLWPLRRGDGLGKL